MTAASVIFAFIVLALLCWEQSKEANKWKKNWEYCKRLLVLTREQLTEKQRAELELLLNSDEQLKRTSNPFTQ